MCPLIHFDEYLTFLFFEFLANADLQRHVPLVQHLLRTQPTDPGPVCTLHPITCV